MGYGTWDKINHAYAFGGTAMSINSVQNLLDIPIDFYVSVNMEGIKEVVDAVGGVDVNSPIAFNQNGYDFVVGTNYLDGEAALSFSRMRYEDPAGDTGRQGRQRLVIEAVLRKLATPETLMNYQAILASFSANVQTNFQMNDYLSLRSNDYLAAANNIQQEQLGGAGGMMDGIYYNFVDDARTGARPSADAELNWINGMQKVTQRQPARLLAVKKEGRYEKKTTGVAPSTGNGLFLQQTAGYYPNDRTGHYAFSSERKQNIIV